MANTIDIAIQIMKGLDAKETGMFQRDGCFYIVSEKGFAQITFGLYPEIKQDRWEKGELTGFYKDYAQMAIVGREKEYPNNILFGPGEKQYFEPIVFKDDYFLFSLEKMANIAKKLSKNKEDNKIRIVEHGYRYHSHKHGYAVDGTDVELVGAWTAEKENYLKAIKEKENYFLEDFREYLNANADIDYKKLQQFTLLTPNICMHFPLNGDLFRKESDGSKLDAWTTTSSLEEKSRDAPFGTILRRLELPYKAKESPFRNYIKVNALENEIKTEEDYKKFEEYQKVVQSEIALVKGVQPSIEEIIGKLNTQFNRRNASEIENHKAFQKRLDESKRKEGNN